MDKQLIIPLATSALFLVIAIGVGYALEPSSQLALFLVDRRLNDGTFPATIPIAMWAVLGYGVGEFARLFVASRQAASALGRGLLPTDADTKLRQSALGGLAASLRTDADSHGEAFLHRLAARGLNQFVSRGDVPEVMQVMDIEVGLELQRLDTQQASLRYLAWLIPTLGFLGTVVGLAGALGNMSGGSGAMEAVVPLLALAFNTTILALCMSAVLVLMTTQLERASQGNVAESMSYCVEHLVARLHSAQLASPSVAVAPPATAPSVATPPSPRGGQTPPPSDRSASGKISLKIGKAPNAS